MLLRKSPVPLLLIFFFLIFLSRIVSSFQELREDMCANVKNEVRILRVHRVGIAVNILTSRRLWTYIFGSQELL